MDNRYDYSCLSFQHIHYFITIAELGTMSKAAEILHVTPSLLSQKIAQMENFIGIQLFQRIRRRLILTPAGQQLVVDLRDIRSRLCHVLEFVREQYCVKHNLVLGFSSYQHPDSVNFILENFKQTCPNLDFSVEIQPRKQLIGDFLDQKIDIIVTIDFDRLGHDANVLSRVIGMHPIACSVNPHLPIARKDAITWQDLDRTTCVMPEHFRHSSLVRDLKRKFNEVGIEVLMQFHNGDMMTLNRLVIFNKYITFAAHRPLETLALKTYRMSDLSYPLIVSCKKDADEVVVAHADILYNILHQNVNKAF